MQTAAPILHEAYGTGVQHTMFSIELAVANIVHDVHPDTHINSEPKRHHGSDSCSHVMGGGSGGESAV